MKDLYNNIKYKIRDILFLLKNGYPRDAEWNVDVHFINHVIPPLEKNCLWQLEHLESELNGERYQIVKKMLQLIDEYRHSCDIKLGRLESQETTDEYFAHDRCKEKTLTKLIKYFGEHHYTFWE